MIVRLHAVKQLQNLHLTPCFPQINTSAAYLLRLQQNTDGRRHNALLIRHLGRRIMQPVAQNHIRMLQKMPLQQIAFLGHPCLFHFAKQLRHRNADAVKPISAQTVIFLQDMKSVPQIIPVSRQPV